MPDPVPFSRWLANQRGLALHTVKVPYAARPVGERPGVSTTAASVSPAGLSLGVTIHNLRPRRGSVSVVETPREAR